LRANRHLVLKAMPVDADSNDKPSARVACTGCGVELSNRLERAMEHSNQVGSYAVAHKGLMNLLSDSVMAQLTQPVEADLPALAEQPLDLGDLDTFYFRARGKRCSCAQCKAVRAAM
jgi:hypothetical protein